MCEGGKNNFFTLSIKKIQKIVQPFGTLFLPPEPLYFFPGFPSWKCCTDGRFLTHLKGFLYLSSRELRDLGSEHSQTKRGIYSSCSGFWVSSMSIS